MEHDRISNVSSGTDSEKLMRKQPPCDRLLVTGRCAMPRKIDTRRPEDCSAYIDRAASRKERIRVARGGKEIAAVIPIEDLELLEQFEERLDALEALDAIEEARERGGVIPWEQFEAELGLR